ncbi:MAG: MarC family protein [Holosporales bacterium]|jgi:multiple antibiotic resistance protein|nr:MarC family protein [Holosporales bacterium]
MVDIFDVGMDAFVRLIALVLNPLIIVPLFLGLTGNQTLQERKATATKGVLVAMSVFLATALSGESLFQILGISFPAFKVAGGILLFLSALSMVNPPPETEGGASSRSDVAVFPLAIPIITGPGAMTYGAILVKEAEGDINKIAVIIVAALAVFFLNWICYQQAQYIVRLLGKVGLDIVQRICGVIIAGLALTLVLGGIRESFPSVFG